jgi:predicted DNA-binding ribbon-helix-helix protein
VGYHVALELNQEQTKKLKLLATSRDLTVKDLVTQVVQEEIKESENPKKSKN